MVAPKSGIASVIVKKLKAEPVEAPKEKPESESDAGKKEAAQKLLDGIAAKDAKLVLAALSDFLDIHELSEKEEDKEEENFPMMPEVL